MFVGILVVLAMVGGVMHLINQVEVPEVSTPVETSFVCLADVGDGKCGITNAVAQYSSAENRVLVRYADIPPVMIRAVVAAEDRHFFEHGGVDPLGIARAVFRAATNTSESRQGASTITQQYVKKQFLTNEQSLGRKLNEAALAIQLERQLSKEEILERYLNEVYFGRGAYGVEAAAQAYFDVTMSELTLPQAALLAGLLRAPEKADPSRRPEEAKRRRRTVLVAMREMGLITREEAEAADAEPFEGNIIARTTQKNTRVEPAFANVGGEYVAEWVRQQLGAEPLRTAIGSKSVYDAGLRIYLTIDPKQQEAAFRAIATTLIGEGDPPAALASIDERARIVALVGGDDYRNNKVNYALGTAGGGSGRPAGSTFKAFALAAFVEADKSIQSVYPAPASTVYPRADDGRDWTVSNYDEKDLGHLTVEQATWHSSNTAYAQLARDVGFGAVADMAKRMGITSDVRPVASTVLGTTDVSVLELATAYSTLANHGVLQQPYVIRRVEDARGNLLFQAPEPEGSQVISPEVADTVTQALRGVISNGTGQAAKLRGVQAAGKTGTTGDYKDAWFAGYTCHLTSVVWMGYETPQPMDDVRGRKVTGGGYPAEIWKAYMGAATEGHEKCTYREIDAGTQRVNPELVAGPPTTTTTTVAEAPPTTETPSGGETEGGPEATTPTTTEAPPAGDAVAAAPG